MRRFEVHLDTDPALAYRAFSSPAPFGHIVSLLFWVQTPDINELRLEHFPAKTEDEGLMQLRAYVKTRWNAQATITELESGGG